MMRERYPLPSSALDIYLPNKRAKRCIPPYGQRTPAAPQSNQSDKEAWMRAKQAKKRESKEHEEAAARLEQVRKANLYYLAEAEAEVRRRRMIENLRG